MKLSFRKAGGGSRVELAMTSMIDVIFLLLIFFMLNVGFHLAERELESGIQTEASGRSKSRLDPVIVEIARGANGEFRMKLGAREFNDPAELTSVLARMKGSGGAFVKAGDDAPFALAASAIQACSDAGFLAISYIPGS